MAGGWRVLIIGGGAREHTLTWSAVRSPRVSSVLVAPGNAGTSALGRNAPVDPMDVPALVDLARREQVDLAIVGPDDPLAAGVVDALITAGIRAFGPTRAAAQIEASKAWSKQFMERHGIPTAPYAIFDDVQAAHRFVDSQPQRLVVKADGLARGKGAIVCASHPAAHHAVAALMERRVFGAAGERVVIERCLDGPEASVFAICDGETALPLGEARDHKRLLDGDRGPNTGGMGAYSPTRLVGPAMLDQVMHSIIRPVVAGMAAEGRPFCGFLYAGLMFTADGPQVIEFNARLGDPEAQAILPRLESDLMAIVEAALDHRLNGMSLRWQERSSCAVCLASAGYPDTVRDGVPLRQDGAPLEQEPATAAHAAAPDALLFHAGTVERNGQLLTRGGRVLTVVGLGDTLGEARRNAYRHVEPIEFEGMQYRRDIGVEEAAS